MTDYVTERAVAIYRLAEPAHAGTEPLPTVTDLPLWRTYAVLSFAKGIATTAEDVHDAWSAFMAGVFPEHRSLVPFADLPEHVKRLDDPYVAAIREAAAND